MDGQLLEKGSILQAKAYVNQTRLEMEITSVLIEDYIIGVSLVGYDTYGNRGLGIYEYKQIRDSNELLANLGSTASNSISFNSSAKDQIITNLSGDMIKGVGAIFSKNLRSVKVFLEKDKEILFVYAP